MRKGTAPLLATSLAICFILLVSRGSAAFGDSLVTTIPVSYDPYAIVYDSSNGDLYVTDTGEGIPEDCSGHGLGNCEVHVIDGSTNALVGSPISVGEEPSALAFDSTNGDVYVGNYDASVTVIDGSTNTVVTTIAGASLIGGLTFDSSSGNIYVSTSLSFAHPKGFLTVIDGSTNLVTDTILCSTPPNCDSPGALAFDSSNGNVYVTNSGGSVSVLDTATNKIVGAPIPVGNGPVAIVSDPLNAYLYVANSLDNTLSVIDGSTNTIVGSPISVGVYPVSLAVDTSSGQIYSVNSADNTVSVIDTPTAMVVGTDPVGTAPDGVAFDSTNGDIYVANSDAPLGYGLGSGSVSVISPSCTGIQTQSGVTTTCTTSTSQGVPQFPIPGIGAAVVLAVAFTLLVAIRRGVEAPASRA